MSESVYTEGEVDEIKEELLGHINDVEEKFDERFECVMKHSVDIARLESSLDATDKRLRELANLIDAMEKRL